MTRICSTEIVGREANGFTPGIRSKSAPSELTGDMDEVPAQAHVSFSTWTCTQRR